MEEDAPGKRTRTLDESVAEEEGKTTGTVRSAKESDE
jgi:hypothetical protein